MESWEKYIDRDVLSADTVGSILRLLGVGIFEVDVRNTMAKCISQPHSRVSTSQGSQSNHSGFEIGCERQENTDGGSGGFTWGRRNCHHEYGYDNSMLEFLFCMSLSIFRSCSRAQSRYSFDTSRWRCSTSSSDLDWCNSVKNDGELTNPDGIRLSTVFFTSGPTR